MKKYEKLINKMKEKMQKIKQKTKVREENKLKIENVINLSCTNLNDEEITVEMHIEENMIRLGKIADDLRRKVTQLEEQVKPRTPLHLIDEI